MSVALRYSELLTVIAHHATLAADAAMKNPYATDPGPAFQDHLNRMAELTEYIAAALPGEDPR